MDCLFDELDERSKCKTIQEFFNRYQFYLNKKLGSGKFGKVYIAKDKLNNERYAIKVINLKKNYVAPFVREVKALYALNKTMQIVSIIDHYIYQKDKIGFIVMDLANCDLYDYIHDMSRLGYYLDLDAILNIFSEIVYGVKACHDIGYIHGDLKLENIFIFYDNKDKKLPIYNRNINRITLGDLGYMREIRLTNKPIIYGSTTYSAPESFTKHKYILKEYDRTKLDVWALGVILYTLLTRKNPFSERKDSQSKYKIVNYHPKIYVEKWGSNVTKILKGTLQKNPKNRMNVNDIVDILKKSIK